MGKKYAILSPGGLKSSLPLFLGKSPGTWEIGTFWAASLDFESAMPSIINGAVAQQAETRRFLGSSKASVFQVLWQIS